MRRTKTATSHIQSMLRDIDHLTRPEHTTPENVRAAFAILTTARGAVEELERLRGGGVLDVIDC